jgi:hypothetical protein
MLMTKNTTQKRKPDQALETSGPGEKSVTEKSTKGKELACRIHRRRKPEE